MPKITIDGIQIEAREGANVLQAALEAGIQIPHFCYHPRLKVAGNCRMCLVEIEKAPKLQIACGTQVKDGMVVLTKTERVQKARRGVLEFLLVNHPLDCPICDRCGECRLQDYCFEYGQEKSRFREEKHCFERQDIGPNVVRNQNRCLHCARCIRFLRDVAGSEEFCLFERGGHTQVGTYLEKAVASPFSMNLAEVCPVGALTSRHFRFKGRSWLMQKTRTLCAGCARGCNVDAWAYQGTLLRLTPTENPQVNLCWMCDEGRRTVDRVHAKDRLPYALSRGERIDHEAALDEIGAKLRPLIGPGAGEHIGVLVGAGLTNEDLYAVRKLAREVIGTRQLAFVAGKPDDTRPFLPSDRPLPEWFIRDDRTPNSRGAREIIGATEHLADPKALLGAASLGAVKAMLVFGADPIASLGDPAAARTALEKLELLVVLSSHQTATTARAHWVLPEATFGEKDGSLTNEGGRVQRLRAAIPAAGESRSAWQIALALAGRLGTSWPFQTAADVMAEIAVKVPGFQDISYASLPETGQELGQK